MVNRYALPFSPFLTKGTTSHIHTSLTIGVQQNAFYNNSSLRRVFCQRPSKCLDSKPTPKTDRSILGSSERSTITTHERITLGIDEF